MVRKVDNFNLRGAFNYLVEDQDEGGMGLTRPQAESQIAQRLAKEIDFDYTAATDAGFNNEQIISKLTGIEKQGFLPTVAEGTARGAISAVPAALTFIPGVKAGAALGTLGGAAGIIGGGILGGIAVPLATSLVDQYVGLSKGVGDFLLGEEEPVLPSDQPYREAGRLTGSLLTFSGAIRRGLAKSIIGDMPTGQTGAALVDTGADFGSKKILANLRKYDPDAKIPLSLKALQGTENLATRMATRARGSQRDYYLQQEIPIAIGAGVGAGLAERIDPGDAVTSFFSSLGGALVVPVSPLTKIVSGAAAKSAQAGQALRHPVETLKSISFNLKNKAESKARNDLVKIYDELGKTLEAPGRAKASVDGVPYDPLIHSPEVDFTKISGQGAANLMQTAREVYGDLVPGVEELLTAGTTPINPNTPGFEAMLPVFRLQAEAMAKDPKLKALVSNATQEAVALSAKMLQSSFEVGDASLIAIQTNEYQKAQEKFIGEFISNKFKGIAETLDKAEAKGTLKTGQGGEIVGREILKLFDDARKTENVLYSTDRIDGTAPVIPKNTAKLLDEDANEARLGGHITPTQMKSPQGKELIKLLDEKVPKKNVEGVSPGVLKNIEDVEKKIKIPPADMATDNLSLVLLSNAKVREQIRQALDEVGLVTEGQNLASSTNNMALQELGMLMLATGAKTNNPSKFITYVAGIQTRGLSTEEIAASAADAESNFYGATNDKEALADAQADFKLEYVSNMLDASRNKILGLQDDLNYEALGDLLPKIEIPGGTQLRPNTIPDTENLPVKGQETIIDADRVSGTIISQVFGPKLKTTDVPKEFLSNLLEFFRNVTKGGIQVNKKMLNDLVQDKPSDLMDADYRLQMNVMADILYDSKNYREKRGYLPVMDDRLNTGTKEGFADLISPLGGGVGPMIQLLDIAKRGDKKLLQASFGVDRARDLLTPAKEWAKTDAISRKGDNFSALLDLGRVNNLLNSGRTFEPEAQAFLREQLNIIVNGLMVNDAGFLKSAKKLNSELKKGFKAEMAEYKKTAGAFDNLSREERIKKIAKLGPERIEGDAVTTVADVMRMRRIAGEGAADQNVSPTERRLLSRIREKLLDDLSDPSLTAPAEALVSANTFSKARQDAFTRTVAGEQATVKLKYTDDMNTLLDKVLSQTNPNVIGNNIRGLQKIGNFFEEQVVALRNTGEPELLALVDEILPAAQSSAKTIENSLVQVIRGMLLNGVVEVKPQRDFVPTDIKKALDGQFNVDSVVVNQAKLKKFKDKYQIAAEQNPMIKELFDDMSDTETARKVLTDLKAGAGIAEESIPTMLDRQAEKKALSDILGTDSPTYALSQILESRQPDTKIKALLAQLNRMKTSNIPVTYKGEKVAAKEVYEPAVNGLMNSFIQVAREASYVPKKEIYGPGAEPISFYDAKIFRQVFFETGEVFPAMQDLPPLADTLLKQGIINKAKYTQIKDVTESMERMQNQQMFMERLPAMAEEKPNVLKRFATRFFGAQVGARLGTMAGGRGTIQIPGFAAGVAEDLMSKAPSTFFISYMGELFQPGGYTKLEEMLEATAEETIRRQAGADYGFSRTPLLDSPLAAAAPVEAITRDREEQRAITPPPPMQPISQASPSVNPMQTANQRARYAAMFPLDPASSLIKERQAQGIGSLPRP